MANIRADWDTHWTDYAGSWLAAQKEVERVGEHRLSGARLPRDRVEARAGPQFGPSDQQQVLDAQLQEHASGLPTRSDGAALLRRGEAL